MKTSRLSAVVLGFCLLSSGVPRICEAQEDAVTVQARARFKEGVDYYDKGQFEHARLAFLQAYTLKKHPAVLLNLAQSSARSGHSLEAAKYFHQFLKESASATAQQRQDAEAGLADVRQKLGRIEIVAPAGSDITLDEKERIGTAPFGDAIDVEPGSHTLRSNNETVRVNAPAGQKVQAKFTGTPQPAPVAAVPAPPPAAPSPAIATTPEPAPDADGTVKRTNLLSRPANMTPVVIGAAVAGVGIAGAIVFAAFRADAQSKADVVANDIRNSAIERGFDGNGDGRPDATGVCTSSNPAIQRDFANACNVLVDNNKKIDTNNTIAIVSGVVGGAGAAFALGWYLFAPKRDDANVVAEAKSDAPKKPASPVLVPYAGATNAGFLLSGSF